jgi:hypothetical protein
MLNHVFWLKNNTMEVSPENASLVFGSDGVRGKLNLYAALHTDSTDTELFIKITAKYYANVVNGHKHPLKNAFTTDGMAPAIRYMLQGGWSVSRWRFDYDNWLCSFILSRRATPAGSSCHLGLLMREILSFVPGGETELVLEICKLSKVEGKQITVNELAKEQLKIKKIKPEREVWLKNFFPQQNPLLFQYVPLDNMKLDFKIETGVFGGWPQNAKVNVERLGDEKRIKPVTLSIKNDVYAESDNINIGGLLDSKPGSVAYKATLNSTPPMELTTRIYRQPARLVSFKVGAGLKVHWHTTGVQTLYYNGKRENERLNLGTDVQLSSANSATLFLPTDDGYITSTIYVKNNSNLYLCRTVTAFWHSGMRIIRLEWGSVKTNSISISDVHLSPGEKKLHDINPQITMFEYVLMENDLDYKNIKITGVIGEETVMGMFEW